MSGFHVNRIRQRGAVLLLVLGAIAILSILAVQLAHRANLANASASRAGTEANFRRMFTSGLEISKCLISTGRSTQGYDTASDPWTKLTQVDTGPREHLKVQLCDESGKLNFQKFAGTTDDAARFKKAMARLLDYLHKTDEANDRHWDEVGAAMRVRLGIDKADSVAPIYTLDGFREAGIAKEILYGNMGDEPAHAACLYDFLTPFGDGRINLNTAPAPVLSALDEEYSDDVVAQILSWRGNANGGNDAAQPFKTASELEQVPGIVERTTVDGKTQVVKDLYLKIQDQVSVQSTCISARLIADINGQRRMAFAYFEVLSGAGKSQQLKLLSFEEIEP